MGSLNPAEDAVSYESGVQVGDLLYVAAHQKGLHVLDVAAPASPQLQEVITLPNNACWDVVAHGGYLLAANGRHGLSVVDPSVSTQIATLALPGLANDIDLSDDGAVAYLTLGAAGVAAVDVSQPDSPALLSLAPTLGNAFSMGRVGDVLAVGSYPYAERYDVGDPSHIQLAGWDATKVYAMGAAAGTLGTNDTVLVVADWRGMAVYAPGADPTGDIDVYPTRLDFGAVATQKDTIVKVRNTGAGPLQVLSIDSPGNMTASPSAFTLPAGETMDVTITAYGSETVWSSIYYLSDDDDEAFVEQFVYANNTEFPQVGSPAPDFALLGTDGEVHSLSDYHGRVIYLEFGASW
ncbi:MAG: hypothetical protein GF355_03640 [Candidatus Eisenbacteria bacterium]|nr:hypothetical protein [Candidatus Eisenbacteria bacterium]